MPETREWSSRQHAVDLLSAHIQKGAWKTGERLPTLTSFSNMLGLSRNSIGYAVKILAARKTLTVFRKKGIFLGTPAPIVVPSKSAAQINVLKWQKLRLTIERDIFNGVYAANADLPGVAILLIKYGVSYPTLKKAVHALVDAGILSLNKRTYRVHGVSQIRQIRSPFKIVAFVPAVKSGLFLAYEQGLQYIRHIEQECRNHNMQLELFGIYLSPEGGKILSRENVELNLPDILRSTAATGFSVFWPGWITDARGILASLCRTGKPVACLLSFPDDALTRPFADEKQLHFFMHSNERAAYDVGKYLLHRGHRSIAYIGYDGDPGWSRIREKGLFQAYAEAGFGNAVTVITSDSLLYNVARHQYNRDHESWLKHAMRFSANLSRLFSSNTNAEYLHQLLGDMIGQIEAKARPMMRSRYFISSLDRALENSTITAIVGCNDEVAVQAYYYLKARHVAVPQQISLIGFDDTVDSIRINLSTYNFNIGACVARMVEYLLQPRRDAYLSKRRSYAIDGFIVERQTTGQALKPAELRNLAALRQKPVSHREV